MSELSDKMGDSRAQRAMDGELTDEDREEMRREQAATLSTEGEAGQSATPQQAARGEAADGEPLRTAGGVSEQLEEAADMGSADGLGAEAPKTLEELAQEVSLEAAAEVLCEKSLDRVTAEEGVARYDSTRKARGAPLQGWAMSAAHQLVESRAAEERAMLVFQKRVRIAEAEEAGTR